METKNKTNTKNVNELHKNEKMTQVFSGEHSLTILLLVISGFMVFWFLLSGAMSDNRFGTHLVMSADLTSIPAWYGLSIFFIASFLTISGFILFFLLFRGKIHLTESQEKSLRVGALSMMGASAFYIALSSITFAAFNTEFFTSVLIDRQFHWSSLAPIITPFGKFSSSTYYSMQGVVLASMSIITFAIIMGVTAFLVFAKTEVSNKFYYSGRNAAVLMIAFGWLTFNVNIVAFGSMGGDTSVLINGILGTNIDFNEIGEKTNGALLTTWSQMSAKTFWKDVLGNPKPWIGAQIFFEPFWNEGILKIPLTTIDIDLGMGVNVILGFFGDLLSTDWISGLSKDSFIQGVNDSVAAYMLFGAFILGTLVSPLYIILTYFTFKDNKISIMYDWSIYTVMGVSVIYGILAWTIPYMSFANFAAEGQEIYRPILDGFIKGQANGLAPGLIGQTGQPGGINGALVYFSPNYHGTITWWVGFGIMGLIPFTTMGLAIWKNFDDLKSNSTIF